MPAQPFGAATAFYRAIFGMHAPEDPLTSATHVFPQRPLPLLPAPLPPLQVGIPNPTTHLTPHRPATLCPQRMRNTVELRKTKVDEKLKRIRNIGSGENNESQDPAGGPDGAQLVDVRPLSLLLLFLPLQSAIPKPARPCPLWVVAGVVCARLEGLGIGSVWKADKCREGLGECVHMRINVSAHLFVFFAFMSVCSRVCRLRATRNATQLYLASCPRVQNPETCPRPADRPPSRDHPAPL